MILSDYCTFRSASRRTNFLERENLGKGVKALLKYPALQVLHNFPTSDTSGIDMTKFMKTSRYEATLLFSKKYLNVSLCSLTVSCRTNSALNLLYKFLNLFLQRVLFAQEFFLAFGGQFPLFLHIFLFEKWVAKGPFRQQS